MQDKGGSADIMLSKGVICLNGVDIPCIKVGETRKTRRVKSAEDYCIPAHSELVIDAFIERAESDDTDTHTTVIIEPTETFCNIYPLSMAASLSDYKYNTSHKIRLLNPHAEPVNIKQDVTLGSAETVDLLGMFYDGDTAHEQSETKLFTSHNSTARRHELQHTVPSHLEDMVNSIAVEMSEVEREQVMCTLEKYQAAFSRNELDLGITNMVEHTIDVGDHRPIKQPPRRVPIAFAGEEEAVIKQMEKQGIIRPSTSPWASPIVLVRKKSGKIRPCIDYRRLNGINHKGRLPIAENK